MIDLVLNKMDAQIHIWDQSKDKRRHFLQCYRLMTSNMIKAVELHRFNDNNWVGQLLENFAAYYFNALSAYETKESKPVIWYDVFEKTTSTDLSVLQSILVGVNAHINYDLVFSLKDMLVEEWPGLDPQQKEQRYNDHKLVNQIIAETIDEVQDQIIEPHNYAMKVIDQLFGRLDEYLLSILITSWREEVWQHAIKLIECDHKLEATILDDIKMNVRNKMSVLAI